MQAKGYWWRSGALSTRVKVEKNRSGFQRCVELYIWKCHHRAGQPGKGSPTSISANLRSPCAIAGDVGKVGCSQASSIDASFDADKDVTTILDNLDAVKREFFQYYHLTTATKSSNMYLPRQTPSAQLQMRPRGSAIFPRYLHHLFWQNTWAP